MIARRKRAGGEDSEGEEVPQAEDSSASSSSEDNGSENESDDNSSEEEEHEGVAEADRLLEQHLTKPEEVKPAVTEGQLKTYPKRERRRRNRNKKQFPPTEGGAVAPEGTVPSDEAGERRNRKRRERRRRPKPTFEEGEVTTVEGGERKYHKRRPLKKQYAGKSEGVSGEEVPRLQVTVNTASGRRTRGHEGGKYRTVTINTEPGEEGKGEPRTYTKRGVRYSQKRRSEFNNDEGQGYPRYNKRRHGNEEYGQEAPQFDAASGEYFYPTMVGMPYPAYGFPYVPGYYPVIPSFNPEEFSKKLNLNAAEFVPQGLPPSTTHDRV